MTLTEIWAYYGRNYSNIVRELKVGATTLQKWKKRGYIPIRSQMVLEKRSNGLFKARLEDAQI